MRPRVPTGRVLHVGPDPPPSLAHDARSVRLAPDADTGFARYRATDVDCVVVASDLPAADGLSVLRAIRALDERTPVVVYDDGGDPALAMRVAALGGTYHRRTGEDRVGRTVGRTLAGRRRAAGAAAGGPPRGRT